MKIIITGASGMVGSATLLEAIDDNRISEILLINRRSINLNNTKVKELIVDSFDNLGDLEDKLNGYDLCVHCIGISANGVSEKQYRYVTYDIAVKVADTLYKINPNMVFCYVSGAGAYDNDRKGIMWAMVKGEAERYVLSRGFRDAYAFRPAGILPEKGVKSQVKLYNTIYNIVRPLYPLLKRMKFVTTSSKLGKALINVAFFPQSKKRLESEDIKLLAEL